MSTRSDAVALYTSGLSIAAVAKALKRNPSTIYMHLLVAGALRRKVVGPSKSFNGHLYYRCASGYWRRQEKAVGRKTVYLHRAVWQHAHGRIKKGWEIHHKDHDKDNNALSNLECLPAGQHTTYHRNTEVMCRLSKQKQISRKSSEASQRARRSQ